MLTNVQLQTLKTWVIANANSVFEQSTADLLNTQASPDFFVWRSSVAEADIINNGLDFTLIDGLTQGKRDEWSNFLFKFGSCNPSKPNVRAGIIDVWSGNAPKNAVQLSVWGHCQKKATVAEKMFASGTGTAAIVGGTGPATMGFEGLISVDDLIAAANS